MPHNGPLEPVAVYYTSKLREFGPTPRGADWSSEASQELRFVQLLKVLDGVGPSDPFTLLDVGCGYGALVGFLRKRFTAFRYWGYDVAPEMARAAERWAADAPGKVSVTSLWSEIPTCDFAVASGIFNVRLQASDEVWRAHLFETLRAIDSRAARGWAANFLTTYSDPPRRRPDLYYADPRELFDWCKTQVSPHVALLHDYPLWEFTLVVRKLPSAG